MGDTGKERLLSACFTEIYSLDADAEGDANAQRALETPELFVMKPQREGGGNNIYGKSIPQFMASLSRENRAAFILMKLIKPRIRQNTQFLKNGKVIVEDGVCELGIYGAYLRLGKDDVINEATGYLMRTKPVGIDEGGIVAGFAALDCPSLH